MPDFLPPSIPSSARVMMFVDGENLAIRYQTVLGDGKPKSHVRFEPNVFVWSQYANRVRGPQHFVRRHYYTSLQGDKNSIDDTVDALIALGIEAPRVFPKPKGKRAKRVDIMLTTEMLTHAHRKNYDVAILVAGDEDYVPLVEAVAQEGCQVALWFVQNGLSPALRRGVDHFFDLGAILFADATPDFRIIYG